jgi:NCS1 family nucleobase:cation symporter-1
MATHAERLAGGVSREAPEWGISPVPDTLRLLGARDMAVLWGDLAVGLLVLVSGTFLVPALGLPSALAAIGVGSVVGCVPLALVAVAGARERVPGMVLFRPVLGLRGSYLPSAANLIQLTGWTAFEFWAMARVGSGVTARYFNVDARVPWLAVVAVVCTALAWAGPVFVVRRWLERFGIWIVLASAGFLTVKLLTAGHIGTLWSAPGSGGLSFGLAVDLVIANPVSWLPLVADLSRFARDDRSAALGTFGGYLTGNVWFYALGALLVLAAGSGTNVADVGTAIATTAGGVVVVLVLLAGESDQAMANVYSSAVSMQNVRPHWSQRRMIVVVGVIGFFLAAIAGDRATGAFEYFLYLVGSVFVPLFGVFAAHYLVRAHGRYGEAALFEGAGSGIRWRALIPWLAGFLVYQWCVPTGPAWWTGAVERVINGWLRLPNPLFGSRLGASAPSFVVAFVLAVAVLPAWGEGS